MVAMYFTVLFVATMTFNGVLSVETIARVLCDGGLVFGQRCIVSQARSSDVGMLEARLVNGSDGCTEGRYYIELYDGDVFVVVLARCSGSFDVVKLDPPPYTGGCGVNIASDGLRIIGGNRAPACQYPWMVWIVVPPLICGGFIVDKDHIITGSHCILKSSQTTDDIQVVTGSIHKQTGVKRRVKEVFRHPNFNATFSYNDIAVIRLNQSMKFDGCQSPVCLGDDPDFVTEGSNCRMMGWGIISESRKLPHNWLQWANETILSDEECKKEFPFGYPNGSVICGHASDAAFCTGDGGSPLVCLDGNKWFAYGIVSSRRGRRCLYKTGLYTSIPFYYKWIKETMATI